MMTSSSSALHPSARACRFWVRSAFRQREKIAPEYTLAAKVRARPPGAYLDRSHAVESRERVCALVWYVPRPAHDRGTEDRSTREAKRSTCVGRLLKRPKTYRSKTEFQTWVVPMPKEQRCLQPRLVW